MISDRSKIIVRKHPIDKIDKVICMYIDETSGWVPVALVVRFKAIVEVLGLHATVNFQIAAAPIIAEMTYVSCPRRWFVNTVTVGPRRYQ